jgi:hypothetical protein
MLRRSAIVPFAFLIVTPAGGRQSLLCSPLVLYEIKKRTFQSKFSIALLFRICVKEWLLQARHPELAAGTDDKCLLSIKKNWSFWPYPKPAQRPCTPPFKPVPTW